MGDHHHRLEEHYQNLGGDYEKIWFYEDGTEYQQFLLEGLKEHLKPSPSSRVVDLGAGTGNFSKAFHHFCGLQRHIFCVDPVDALLEQAKKFAEVETLLADGLSFASMEGQGYDRIFLKEAVHHFDRCDLPQLFSGVFRQLSPGGRVVIMTRPHDPSHYPFFRTAREAWSAAQLPDAVYVEALRGAGFEVSVHQHDYRVTMPASQWFRMVRSRFWSNFSALTDGQVEEGVAELLQTLGLTDEASDAPLCFPDRILFVLGEKRG